MKQKKDVKDKMEIIILLLFCAIVSAVIASNKGRSGFGWFLLGCIIGPFAFAVALLPKIKSTKNNVSGPEKKCPFCAEMIKAEAIKCRFCREDLSINRSINDDTSGENDRITDHQHVALSNASFDLPIYAENPSSRSAQMPHGAPCFNLQTIESLERRGYLRNDGKGGYLLTLEGKNVLLNNLKS